MGNERKSTKIDFLERTPLYVSWPIFSHLRPEGLSVNPIANKGAYCLLQDEVQTCTFLLPMDFVALIRRSLSLPSNGPHRSPHQTSLLTFIDNTLTVLNKIEMINNFKVKNQYVLLIHYIWKNEKLLNKFINHITERNHSYTICNLLIPTFIAKLPVIVKYK